MNPGLTSGKRAELVDLPERYRADVRQMGATTAVLTGVTTLESLVLVITEKLDGGRYQT